MGVHPPPCCTNPTITMGSTEPSGTGSPGASTLRRELCEHAVVVGGEDAVARIGEAQAARERLAAAVAIGAAHEDVIDAAVGLARLGGEPVRARIGVAGRAVAGDREAVGEVDAPAEP